MTLNWVWDTPWFAGSDSWLMKNIVGNFTFSGTYTYESPQLATVQSGLDSNLNGDSAGDRAIVNVGGVANTGSGVSPVDRLGTIVKAGRPGNRGLCRPKSGMPHYIVAGLGALTNAGRMTIPTRPINNFDLAIKKGFAIREGSSGSRVCGAILQRVQSSAIRAGLREQLSVPREPKYE